jgi:uncharacterized protein
MTIRLYDASIPVFHRYLNRLLNLVDTAEKHVRSRALDDKEILEARLAPDMLPFETQVRIAANFALRACFPLAGQPLPPYGEFPVSFNGLRACLARASALLATLEPEQFNTSESRVIESRAGNALVSLPAPEFLLDYALPNFFFHMTTAYAILRGSGVPIGKADFDGFHVY